MNNLFKKYLLLIIIILAAVLRLWNLGENPVHLSSDEAALGYNAYSILHTARDEHGALLPIVFQSFGDWKPGFYIYLDVPFIALFGLNEFATRLPGAISGILAVLLIYLVARILLDQYKYSNIVATFSALILAVMPWHLQFSRGAWESGISLTLVLAGIYFFLKAIKQNPKHLIYSVIFFSLTFWAYQGAKLSTTIVVIGLLLVWGRQLFQFSKKLLITGAITGIIIVSPVLLSILQGHAGRLEVYNIFSYSRSQDTINEILSQDNEQQYSLTYDLYHSESLNFARGILGRWMSHFSPKFLLFEGDWTSNRHRVPYNGELLVLDGILLLFGLVAFMSGKVKKEQLFVLYLLLASSLPAAFSRDSIHAVRSLNMVIPLAILLGFGFYKIIEVSKNPRMGRLLLTIFMFIYVGSFIYYLDQYWVHAPVEYSKDWQYGYKQVVQSVNKIQYNYPEIVMQQSYEQPYIFFLFYKQYDPKKYQKNSSSVYEENKYGDVGLINRLDNITFREANWSADRGMHGKLFIYDTIRVPEQDSNSPREFKVIDEIKYLNGHTAFRFIEVL
jgi:4-amino-4-deoxy-L-arabinose transferase-like glycosyltransferase